MATCSPTRRERLYYALLKQIEPRYERLVYPRFDSCVVVADSDARALRSVAPRCQPRLFPTALIRNTSIPGRRRRKGPAWSFTATWGMRRTSRRHWNSLEVIFPLIRKQAPQAVFHLVGAKPAKEIREIASWPGIMLSADLPDLRNGIVFRPRVCLPLTLRERGEEQIARSHGASPSHRFLPGGNQGD